MMKDPNPLLDLMSGLAVPADDMLQLLGPERPLFFEAGGWYYLGQDGQRVPVVLTFGNSQLGINPLFAGDRQIQWGQG